LKKCGHIGNQINQQKLKGKSAGGEEVQGYWYHKARNAGIKGNWTLNPIDRNIRR
jgi:hypothetical protein